ncbi:hypothetical protein BDA99DRAFT_507401 [Phascolomyces articulosus]|uniref:Uncharacterized protein n=1 Tax=Phascolomyces articulosus TaxID=60185 RepID=A0AAD5K1S7_9FUNG|nr:hypothetical protein BDA99DRAFT_507401 [Phascolomyces articulosus]
MDQDWKHNKLSSFHVYIPLTVCKSSQIFLKFLLIYLTSFIKTQKVSENKKPTLFLSLHYNLLLFWLSQVVVYLCSFIFPGGYSAEQSYRVLVLPFLFSYLWAQRDFPEAGGCLWSTGHATYVLAITYMVGSVCVLTGLITGGKGVFLFFSSWRKKEEMDTWCE